MSTDASASVSGGEQSGVSKIQARHLMQFFAIVYLAEGLAQVSGIMHQPLQKYCLDILGWHADKIGAYLAVLGLPWTVKPLWGLLSDALPIFGYRRKSYLILFNAFATVAFVGLAVMTEPDEILVALMIISIAMAASSSIFGALLVENGKSSGMNAKFCSQQTLWANIANVAAALAGGWLCFYLTAAGALHVGALIGIIAPLMIIVSTIYLVSEHKTQANVVLIKETGRGIASVLVSKQMWFVGGFLALWAFNPGFGSPLYAHMRKGLHFDDSLIGKLNCIFFVGAALGAFIYQKVLAKKLAVKQLTYLVIFLGVAAQLAYIAMNGPVMALSLQFVHGVTTAMATLTAHVIAANKCPNKAEGFLYSAILSITNLSYFTSEAVGGYIYVQWFNSQINLLIVASALFTLSCAFLVPFFNLEKETNHG